LTSSGMCGLNVTCCVGPWPRTRAPRGFVGTSRDLRWARLSGRPIRFRRQLGLGSVGYAVFRALLTCNRDGMWGLFGSWSVCRAGRRTHSTARSADRVAVVGGQQAPLRRGARRTSSKIRAELSSFVLCGSFGSPASFVGGNRIGPGVNWYACVSDRVEFVPRSHAESLPMALAAVRPSRLSARERRCIQDRRSIVPVVGNRWRRSVIEYRASYLVIRDQLRNPVRELTCSRHRCER